MEKLRTEKRIVPVVRVAVVAALAFWAFYIGSFASAAESVSLSCTDDECTVVCSGYDEGNSDGYCTLQASSSTSFVDNNTNAINACGIGGGTDCTIGPFSLDLGNPLDCNNAPLSDPFYVRGRVDDENASTVTLAWSSDIYRVDCDAPAVTTLEGGGGATMGNGIVESPEVCDDGNTTDGDGCDSVGAVETGWTCDGADPTVCTEDPVPTICDTAIFGDACKSLTTFLVLTPAILMGIFLLVLFFA